MLRRSLLTNSHLTNGVGLRSLRLVEVGRRVGILYFDVSPTELILLMLQKSESNFFKDVRWKEGLLQVW